MRRVKSVFVTRQPRLPRDRKRRYWRFKVTGIVLNDSDIVTGGWEQMNRQDLRRIELENAAAVLLRWRGGR